MRKGTYMLIAAAGIFGCANKPNADQANPPAETAMAEPATEIPEPAVEEEPSGRVHVDEDGVALGGYDPVGYHTDNKAVLGDAQYEAKHDGAIYRFTSEEHKATFEADPGKYAPAYGGWCAFGISKDKLVPCDPTSFRVEDGKLYLFSKGEVNGKQLDTAPAWEKDPSMKPTAETNWEAGTPTPIE